jgi:hypothetical protein
MQGGSFLLKAKVHFDLCLYISISQIKDEVSVVGDNSEHQQVLCCASDFTLIFFISLNRNIIKKIIISGLKCSTF